MTDNRVYIGEDNILRFNLSVGVFEPLEEATTTLEEVVREVKSLDEILADDHETIADRISYLRALVSDLGVALTRIEIKES